MHIVHLIKFWFFGGLYKIRRAIPLYMNDHARIASLYAWSILTLFQSPQSSLKSKLKYLEVFSSSFSLPVSIGRLAETLYADPQRKAFDDYYTKRVTSGNVHPNTIRVYGRTPLALSRIPKDSLIENQSRKKKFLYPRRPALAAVFAQLNYISEAKSQANKFSLTSHYTSEKNDHAILLLPLGRLDTADLEALSNFRSLTVMPQGPCDFQKVKSRLQQVLGSDIQIKLYEPTARHAAPYSPGNVYISGFCDDLAEQTLSEALHHRAVRKFIPQALHEDVSLMVSDIIYRPVQTFYAALRAVEVHGEQSAVFYAGPATSLPRTIARAGSNPVYVMTHGTAVETDQDVLDYGDNKFCKRAAIKDIRRIFKYLSARAIKASPDIDTSDAAHIYLATNSWSGPYAKASDLISKKLSKIAPVSVFDYAAPVGLHKNLQASLIPCLHNALLSTRSSDITLISQYIHLPKMIKPEQLAVGKFSANEMKELIVQALERELGAIIGNILLYGKIYEKLTSVKNAILVQCPGRFGNIRCLGRAFQKAGFPTLDVQALFVTEMARYRAPMADHMTVIDSFAEDLYIAQWGLSKEDITPIGSVLLDEDIKLSMIDDPVVLKTKYLSGSQKKVITYASQPLPDREVMEAIKALAGYMNGRNNRHLCIKLHPAQDHVTQQTVEAYLKETLKDSTTFTVLKEPAFSKVMPFTDILISYFSNVCLMAPSHKTPVITLSTTVPIPAVTLANMGLASYVEDYSTLGSKIEELLLKPAKNIHSDYLSKNLHMVELTALETLSTLVEKRLKGQSYSGV